MANLLKFTKINLSGYVECVAINVDKIEHIEEQERKDTNGNVVKCCTIYLPNCKIRVSGSLDDVLNAIKRGKDFVL